MYTVCEEDKCTGCMACLEVCTKHAISVEDSLRTYNAVIDKNKCTECGACHRMCQNNKVVDTTAPILWYQGWANSEEIRFAASSGGFATAIAKTFVSNGGIVCSCTFSDGEFKFVLVDNELEANCFVGSKYVKSNPTGIYGQIKQLLKKKKLVLFIGLPCQVAALKNFVGKQLNDSLYTVDLICHGTPSPQNLNCFLKQYGYNLSAISSISFRRKSRFGLSLYEHTIVTPGALDRYTLAFLNSVNYTENCYHCKYAKIARVSDLTIGDSWGSLLPQTERDKGISLALCQTTKGQQLLMNADLHLEDVDLDNAVEHNHQLKEPSVKPQSYNEFFEGFKSGKKYNLIVKKALPRQCLNQQIKSIMMKTKILRIKK